MGHRQRGDGPKSEQRQLALALHGHGPLPEWAVVLEIAKDWGIPPWQVETEASAEWVERWALMRVETSKPRKANPDQGRTGNRRRLL